MYFKPFHSSVIVDKVEIKKIQIYFCNILRF